MISDAGLTRQPAAAPRRGREGPQAARPGLLGELERLDARLKELKKSLAEVLAEHPTTLLEINGVRPINAAKILAETGDVRRFPSRHHFASHTGTAPVDVSSGDNNRHRLNRGGNRRLNHALHIAAVVQYRMPGPGQDYYRRKRDQGKTHLEALRCLKRRLSDVVYRALVDDMADRHCKDGSRRPRRLSPRRPSDRQRSLYSVLRGRHRPSGRESRHLSAGRSDRLERRPASHADIRDDLPRHTQWLRTLISPMRAPGRCPLHDAGHRLGRRHEAALRWQLPTAL